MISTARPWVVWLFAFLICGGMAFGALVGLTSVSDAARQEGPAGDAAGAAGALMVVVCVVVGFAMATLTIIAAKVRRRAMPDRLALRLCLSIVGGGVIGALGSNSGIVATVLAWFMLVCTPVLLSWAWRPKQR